MDNKLAPQKGNSNMGFIIVGVLVAIAAVLYFVMNGSPTTNDNAAVADPNKDAAEKAAKEKAAKEAAEKAAKEATDKAAKEAAEKAVKDIYANPPQYKRPADALNLSFTPPDIAGLDYYVKTMRDTGWSDDMISYGAAWMKGMDLPINTHWARTQIKSIRDFKSKVPNLPRHPDFIQEVRNYPFMQGDLIEDNRRIFEVLNFNN